MSLYVELDVSSCHATVIGLGLVGQRKALTLLDAHIGGLTLIGPTMPPLLAEAIQGREQVSWHARLWSDEDLKRAGPGQLIFIATDDEALNAAVAASYREVGCWVNVASAPELGQLRMGAVLSREALAIGIWSQGAGPALTLRLRERVAALIDEQGWTLAAARLAQLRRSLRGSSAPQAQRAAFFKALAQALPELMTRPVQAREAYIADLRRAHGLEPNDSLE